MPKDLAATLREAIEASGLSQNQIAKATGVPQPRINTFMNGGDMKLRNASKIARFLGLELRKSKR